MAIRPLLTEITELWPEYRSRGLVDRTSHVFSLVTYDLPEERWGWLNIRNAQFDRA
jgi:hypothetical protein